VDEAQAALREAEGLVTDAAPLRKQAALASTQGECCMKLGNAEQAIAAFRRQGELYHRAGAEFGEYLALGNVGSAQLQSGDLDAAIESLRKAVEGLRRINAPYGQNFRVSMLSIALALRGDANDVLPLAREAFDQLRVLGATSGPLLAAALYLARRDDLRRACLLAGYALSAPRQVKKKAIPIFLQVHERVRDRALMEHPAHYVRWAALQAIFSLDRERGAALLKTAAADPHEHVRTAAIRSLEKLNAAVLAALFKAAGYASIETLGSRPSAYHRARLYAAIAAS